MHPRLLILDDQQMYLRSMERALQHDFAVTGVGTVAEARERCQVALDVVLTDICLNEADKDDRQGLEFIRWLHGQNATISIVAMSAMDDPTLETEARAAGASHFLRKPIVVSQLKALLKSIIGTG